MNVLTLDKLLTPSEMDMAKQYWRSDATTWREKFRPQMPHDRLERMGADHDKLLDALASYFATLPNNVVRQ